MGLSQDDRKRRVQELRRAALRRRGVTVERAARRVSPVEGLEARAAAQAALRAHHGDRLSPRAQDESLARERRLLVAAIKAAGG